MKFQIFKFQIPIAVETHSSASLRGASLRGASVRGAPVRGASVRGAPVRGMSLNGSFVRNILHFTNKHFSFYGKHFIIQIQYFIKITLNKRIIIILNAKNKLQTN
ncbi:hypothetical protein SGQ83_00815 [Flavobacterium sp. Fl-318]|uniref:DUF4236 domain-containing protein n=1 Tax=Flavobacterium cupriresistens TaxID=2893885 RepID=A0ABU4R771_9FLAO|nr:MULTISPECIES: hypothetical protein [unclassified Flavobacterium]MDX6187878.1 hypothetical protein [Flavobacterium sp. Fl-318]UFH42202.1 hypothetical protein LNP23_20635 [Flavobacterium sp. F-323]